MTLAETHDSRAVVELRERDGVLVHASLQLVLVPADDLDVVKLRCWALLFLKSLFPSWRALEHWSRRAAARAAAGTECIFARAQDYRVTCRFDHTSGIVDYQVVRSRDSFE